MAILETRIKVVTTADGKSTYYPQYKGWWFWHSIQVGILGLTDMEPACFSTIEEAQASIDDLLESEARHAQEKKNRVVKQIQFVKYP